MAIRKVLLPLISSGAGEAALSTAWAVAQLWNAHLVALHVQMDLAPTAGAESATASFLILTGRRLDILPQQARLADLTVVRHPATPEEVSSSAVLHAVLFDSGRPPQGSPHFWLRVKSGPSVQTWWTKLRCSSCWSATCVYITPCLALCRYVCLSVSAWTS